MRHRLLIIVMAAALALPGCEQQPADAQTEPAGTNEETPATPVEDPVPETTEKPVEEVDMENLESTVAELKTGEGTIVIRFFPDKAPNHVRNFVELSRQGFYEGTKFHRVIPGFMIQGGDPNTRTGDPSTWGSGGSETNVKAEFNDIPHRRGIVSMARSGHPDSASSQFFIVVKDSRFLDNQYSAFGEVIKGMEVADKIVIAQRGAQDRPDNPVAIDRVIIRQAEPGEIPPAS